MRAPTFRTLFVTMEFKTLGLEPSGVPSLEALISSTSGKPYHREIIVMYSFLDSGTTHKTSFRNFRVNSVLKLSSQFTI